MLRGSPIRVAAALSLAGLLLAGCNRDSASPQCAAEPVAVRTDSPAAPRRIELPAQLRPIALAEDGSRDRPAPNPVAATYERGGDASSRSSGRIVDLSAARRLASPAAIREPLGSGLALTTVEPPPRLASTEPRNQVVPFSTDGELPRLVDPPLPHLAPRPTFSAPLAREEALRPLALGGDQPGPYGGPPPAQIASAGRPGDGRHVAARPVYGGMPPEPQQPVAIPPAVPPPLPAAAYPTTAAPHDAARLQPVVEQAMQISNRGFAMAQRGMFYAARAELIQALQLMAQALDVQQGAGHHARALASGLTALEEARDFQASPGQAAVVDAKHVASGHRTPVLKQWPAAISPVVAQQQYFAYAQAQLAAAVGGERVASQTLYRLGKLETALAAHDDDRHAAHGPQAMVFHQAALSVDSANYLAANELGVLLARYGQLAEARRLLVHSVSLRPHAEGWHNLAVVHRRLGEDDLAKRAENERALLAKKAGDGSQSAELPVRWVDRQTFAASGAREIAWPEDATPRRASPSPSQRR